MGYEVWHFVSLFPVGFGLSDINRRYYMQGVSLIEARFFYALQKILEEGRK